MGAVVSHSLAWTVHEKQVGRVVHFDFLYLGESNVA